jgi:hypothetical protein
MLGFTGNLNLSSADQKWVVAMLFYSSSPRHLHYVLNIFSNQVPQTNFRMRYAY